MLLSPAISPQTWWQTDRHTEWWVEKHNTFFQRWFSNSGYLCSLGGTISWGSRKQNCVALSSTEAEYIALADTCQEVVWLQRLSANFSIAESQPTIIHDNPSCVTMVEMKRFSNRIKHVAVKYHFTCDLKEQGNTVQQMKMQLICWQSLWNMWNWIFSELQETYVKTVTVCNLITSAR